MRRTTQSNEGYRGPLFRLAATDSLDQGSPLSFAWAVNSEPVDGFVEQVVSVFVSKLGYEEIASKADARAKRVVDSSDLPVESIQIELRQ
jgi:hypothetical protein